MTPTHYSFVYHTTLYKLPETLVVCIVFFRSRLFKMLKISNVSPNRYQKTEKPCRQYEMLCGLEQFNNYSCLKFAALPDSRDIGGKKVAKQFGKSIFEGWTETFPYDRCVSEFSYLFELVCEKEFEATGRVRVRTLRGWGNVKTLQCEAPFINT